MVQILAGVAALVMAASLPVAAQVAPERPGIPGNASQTGYASALAKEAQGWLADLIRINTSNPPGNEQIPAMYIPRILPKEGIKAEIVDLRPGRSAGAGRRRSAAMPET